MYLNLLDISLSFLQYFAQNQVIRPPLVARSRHFIFSDMRSDPGMIPSCVGPHINSGVGFSAGRRSGTVAFSAFSLDNFLNFP